MTDQDLLRLQQAETLLSTKSNNNDNTSIAALRTKAIALIKLDRDEDALKLFDEHPKLQEAATTITTTSAKAGVKRDKQLECAYAYALYKCGRVEDVRRIFGNGKDGDDDAAEESWRGLRHVLAQAAYRAEDFETAKTLYGRLTRGEAVVGNESHDLSVNEKAVDAQLEWVSERVGLVYEDGEIEIEIDGFEEAFNVGCRCVAAGDLDRAEEMFAKALDLCKHSDLSEEERKEEMCYILAQQVYLATLRQNKEKAMQMSTSLDLSLLKDPASKRVTHNNTLLYSKAKNNPYLLQRTLSNQETLPEDAYYFGIQKRLLQRNNLALDLATRKYDGLRKPKPSNFDPFQPGELSESIFKAAAQCHCHDNKPVKKRLLRYLRRRPDDVGALLLLLHLHVRNKKRKAALSQLNEFLKNMKSFSPATTRQIKPYLPGLISIWLALVSARPRNRSTNGTSGCTLSENGALIKTGYLLNQRFDAITLSDPLTRVAGAALLTSSNPQVLDKAQKILSSVAAAYDNDPDSNEEDNDDDSDNENSSIDPVANSGIIAAEAQRAALSNPPSSPPPSRTEKITKAILTPIPQIIKPLDAAALERQGGRFQPMHQPSIRTSQRSNRSAQQKKNNNNDNNISTTTPTNKPKPKPKPKPKSNAKMEANKEKSKRTPRKRHLIASKQADAASNSAPASAPASSEPPDPERWLPLRDRSTYKPPRSKTGKGGGGAGGKAKEKGTSKPTGGGGGRQGGT